MKKTADTVRKPLYLEICEYILQEIQDGRFKANQKLVAGEALQKKFKVSKITTEKAFKVLMEKGVVYRIPGRGTFIADKQSAGGTLPVETKSIAFVTPSLISHHILNILIGIESVLSLQGHRLRLCLTNGSFERQEEILRGLRNDHIDGVVIYPVEGRYYDEEILRMKLSRFPFVLVDKHFNKIKTSYVISANAEGSYLGTKELIKRGHRKIAFVSTYSSASTSAIQERIEGFLRAMNEAGVPNPRDLVLQGFDEDVGTQLPHDTPHRKKLIERITEFLVRHRDITALLAISPGNLSHAVRALRGIDPAILKASDIELAIFDLDEFLDFSRTALLTINQRSREIGKRAAEILLEQIEHPDRTQEVILDMDIKNT
jgi:GntR family transcriptional regulator, arabinose operon transcriptional repressor